MDRLAADGHSVLALDNFSTGRPDTLAHLAGHARVRLERADVAEADRLLPLFDGADWVFHLAALADIVPSIERPLDYHRANVNGTAAVLEAARRSGVKRFLYAASSSCYGIPDQYPTPEEAPMRPQYPYALTKLLGEQCVLHWGRVYGLPVVSLRLFNVYGRRSRTSGTYGAVFGVFLAQKLRGRPLTVVGDGTPSLPEGAQPVAGRALEGARRPHRGRAPVVDQVSADEPCAAGDDDPHATAPWDTRLMRKSYSIRQALRS